jgi:uncharacterized protein DUF1016
MLPIPSFRRTPRQPLTRRKNGDESLPVAGYHAVRGDLVTLIGSTRRAAARSVNAIMTATYFLVGRAIVEYEQRGPTRAAYGRRLLERLGADLSGRFGRGFSEDLSAKGGTPTNFAPHLAVVTRRGTVQEHERVMHFAQGTKGGLGR